jgi:phage repressor protein C with HTH and peptisase S24 domain
MTTTMPDAGIFALYIRGTTMEPRFHEGDLVYVDSGRPAEPGDDVLIELHPDEPDGIRPAFIRRLISSAADAIVVRQHNPKREMTVDLKNIARVRHIMTLAEIVGARGLGAAEAEEPAAT